MLHTFPSSENPSYNTINKQIYIKLGTFNNNQQFLLVYDFCLQKYFNWILTINLRFYSLIHRTVEELWGIALIN